MPSGNVCLAEEQQHKIKGRQRNYWLRKRERQNKGIYRGHNQRGEEWETCRGWGRV